MGVASLENRTLNPQVRAWLDSYTNSIWVGNSTPLKAPVLDLFEDEATPLPRRIYVPAGDEAFLQVNVLLRLEPYGITVLDGMKKNMAGTPISGVEF